MNINYRWVVFLLVTLLAVPAAAEYPLGRSSIQVLDQIERQTGSTPDVISVRQDGHPSLVVGDLSRPAKGSAVGLARSFVTEHADLFAAPADEIVVGKQFGNGIGATVIFDQVHQGIPVVGANLSLTVRRDGVVRISSSSLADLGGVGVVPRVSDLDAAMTALDEAPLFIPRNLEGFYARLVVLPFQGGGQLAWELHFGALPAFLSNVWAYVDAETGAMIRYENRISFGYRGRVFETNPGPSDDRVDPIEVNLDIPDGGFEYAEPDYSEEMLDHVKDACDYGDAGADNCPGDDAVWLRHPLFMSRNCPDYHEMISVDFGIGPMNVHMCSESQTIAADEDGNFFADDWQDDNGDFYDLDPNDRFAEVQMFHHVSVVYNYFLDLMDDYDGSDDDAEDWPGHNVKPMMATVNFKIPVKMVGGAPDLSNLAEVTNPNGELYNFDNAFFMAGGPAMGIPGFERPFDSIVFGQGSQADFSWDGDVIYHEFGHSVANNVSPGVGNYFEFGDEWGVNLEAGGMSEGYADSWSGFITNEPTMGEYSLNDVGSIRDMAGADRCPDYLVGEVHYDSPGWSQSLYQARLAAVEEAVAGSMDEAEARHRFDQGAFIGLSSVVQEQGFGEATAATLAAVEDLLGEDVEAAAAGAFTDHNTDGCPRFIDDEGTGTVTHADFFLGIALPDAVSGRQGKPFTPGVVQYKVTVAEGSEALNFYALNGPPLTAQSAPSGVCRPRILVRKDDPIQFSYDFADDENNVLVDNDVMGPYPTEAEGKYAQGGQMIRFSMIGEGGDDLPAGDYYVMPVNAGAERGQLNNIEVKIGEATANEDGTHEFGSDPPDPGSDSDTDSDTDSDADADGGADSDADADGDSDADSDSDGDADGGSGDAGDDDGSDSSCGCTAPGTPRGAKHLLAALTRLIL